MRAPLFHQLRLPSWRIRDGRGCTSRNDVKADQQTRREVSDEDFRAFLLRAWQRRCGNRPDWARRYPPNVGLARTLFCAVYELASAGGKLLATNARMLVSDDLEKFLAFQAWEGVSRAPSNDTESTTAMLGVATCTTSAAAFPG